MLHDQSLVDILSRLPLIPYEGEVFRTTRGALDPTSPSTSGGRWAPAAEPDASFPVLYTSFERDGALAEVASYLIEQSPIPREQPLAVSRLGVRTTRTVRLGAADFPALGIDPSRYGERDYLRTQQVGAALIFLGADGLIAPSARWQCNNLMIFTDNHSLSEKLEVLGSEQVPWRRWAAQHGLLGE